MQEEIWKDIPNYEGIYKVSSLGSIKSLERFRFGNKGAMTIVNSRTLATSINRNGYVTVCLSKNSKKKTRTIHQLVAMAFLNHKPNGHKIVVDHINNIRTDNRLENLQLITQRENTSRNKTSKCKYTGVSLDYNNKFKCSITINGKVKYLGRYNNGKIANAVYMYELEKLINN